MKKQKKLLIIGIFGYNGHRKDIYNQRVGDTLSVLPANKDDITNGVITFGGIYNTDLMLLNHSSGADTVNKLNKNRDATGSNMFRRYRPDRHIILNWKTQRSSCLRFLNGKITHLTVKGLKGAKKSLSPNPRLSANSKNIQIGTWVYIEGDGKKLKSQAFRNSNDHDFGWLSTDNPIDYRIDTGYTITRFYRSATDEDILKTLLKVAKGKGLVDGVNIKTTTGIRIDNLKIFKPVYTDNKLVFADNPRYVLYDNITDTWATVLSDVENKKECSNKSCTCKGKQQDSKKEEPIKSTLTCTNDNTPGTVKSVLITLTNGKVREATPEELLLLGINNPTSNPTGTPVINTNSEPKPVKKIKTEPKVNKLIYLHDVGLANGKSLPNYYPVKIHSDITNPTTLKDLIISFGSINHEDCIITFNKLYDIYINLNTVNNITKELFIDTKLDNITEPDIVQIPLTPMIIHSKSRKGTKIQLTLNHLKEIYDYCVHIIRTNNTCKFN